MLEMFSNNLQQPILEFSEKIVYNEVRPNPW